MDYVRIKGKKFKVKKKKMYWQYYIDKEKNEALKIETLDLYNQNIDDISEVEGLESLTNLISLRLSKNKITEIRGLENLSNLEVLTLDNNQLTEIKGLEGLSNLRYLSVSYNQITEIEGLEDLPNLGTVILGNNRITEIKGLESLNELDWLGLVGNKITEIKGLERNNYLTDLYLDENEIAEIKGLENLKNLKKLGLGNKISEIKGLDSLINLEELRLNGNQITEIKGLERLKNLRILGLSGNEITKIKGLKDFIKLKRLDLSHNQIKEIKGLERLYELEHLDLRGNQDITQIEGLENLQNLNSLNIGESSIPYDIIESLGGFYKAGGEKDALEWIKGLNKDGKANNPQKFVEYCRERGVERRKKEEKIAQIEGENAEDTKFKRLPEIKESFVVFMSYSIKDGELFKIKETAETLVNFNKIDKVLFFESESYDDFIKYMNDNLEKCDIVLLFCSPNASKSKYVGEEWRSAVAMDKPILPIFIKKEHIPPLLKSRVGVEFDQFQDLQIVIDEIYKTILKKAGKRIIDIKDLKSDF